MPSAPCSLEADQTQGFNQPPHLRSLRSRALIVKLPCVDRKCWLLLGGPRFLPLDLYHEKREPTLRGSLARSREECVTSKHVVARSTLFAQRCSARLLLRKVAKRMFTSPNTCISNRAMATAEAIMARGHVDRGNGPTTQKPQHVCFLHHARPGGGGLLALGGRHLGNCSATAKLAKISVDNFRERTAGNCSNTSEWLYSLCHSQLPPPQKHGTSSPI